jgi:hypothetical protein
VSEVLQGGWWTPEVPDLRVPGSLTRVGDGWRLSLIGTLMVNEGGGDGLRLVPPQTLWGSCHEIPYSLLDCYLEEVWGPGADGVGGDGDQWSMRWRVGRVVRGGEVTEATVFSWAGFEMTGLSAWWPPSGLRGLQVRSEAYTRPDHVTFPVQDWEITIGIRDVVSRGRRVRSLRERVFVSASRGSGFTFEELQQQLVTPMRALVAIGVDEPVGVFNLQVVPLDGSLGGERPRPFDVDPHDGEEHEEITSAVLAPLPLSPSLDDLESFIPRWLAVARRFFVPLDAVEPRERSGSLQLQLLEVVSAAETLHRTLHGPPAEYPLADRVAEVLGGSEQFNSRERRDVRDAVRAFVDTKLEKRLLALAEELGPEVCGWLFNGTAPAWAFVTARMRNTLSHGLPQTHTTHEDPGALAGALRLTEAVITLRLLIEAGLPTGTALTDRLNRHRGMRSLAGQTIADWPALAHRISPEAWPDPNLGQPRPPETTQARTSNQ